MMTDVEHFFMSLFTICISSLDGLSYQSLDGLSKSFVHLLLIYQSCKSSSYILATSLL